MKRVLCVWLPNFPIQRLRCEHPELQSAACVLYAESGNRAQVVTSSSEAMRHGIRPGMPLAEAQALLKSAAFVPHDAERDILALKSLALLCDRFSPSVGLELSNGEHCLVLDIAGCTHLFGGEAGLTCQLVIELAERGYFAHLGTANTIGAAWAIACYGHGTGTDRRLRTLPVESLRISDKLAARLHEFDLRTIGQILALPKSSLPSRFGKVLTERLDQMYGHCDEMLVTVPRPIPVSAQWATDDPIWHHEAVLRICTDLLADILDTLKARGEGLLRLTVTLECETTEPVTVEIGLAKPTDSLPHLVELFRLKLETQTVPRWTHTIRMNASVTATLQNRQRGLFAYQEPADNGHVQRLADRLSARLGRDAVVRARILPEAIPEQAVEYTPVSQSQVPQSPIGKQQIACARPLELLPRPESIRVVVVDGALVRFQWKQQSFDVTHSTEPERIATAWWQETGSVRRDYYRVETSTGARYWLFCDGSSNWFLHGVFE